jgi:hypothetical protein
MSAIASKRDARGVLPDGFKDLIDIIDNYAPMLQNIIIESTKEVKITFTGRTNYNYKEEHDCWPFIRCLGSYPVKLFALLDRISGTPIGCNGAQTIRSFVNEGWTFDRISTAFGGEAICLVNAVGTQVILHVSSCSGAASFCGAK